MHAPKPGVSLRSHDAHFLSKTDTEKLVKLVAMHGCRAIQLALGLADSTFDNARHGGRMTARSLDKIVAGLAKLSATDGPVFRVFVDEMVIRYSDDAEDLALLFLEMEGFAIAHPSGGPAARFRTIDGLWERRIVYATAGRAREKARLRRRTDADPSMGRLATCSPVPVASVANGDRGGPSCSGGRGDPVAARQSAGQNATLTEGDRADSGVSPQMLADGQAAE